MLNPFRMRATNPEWAAMDEMADSFGLPREWIACPHCGAMNWRLPPHAFDPCPVVVAVAQSTELKADAERSSAVRMGVHMEEMTRHLQQMFSEEDDDE